MTRRPPSRLRGDAIRACALASLLLGSGGCVTLIRTTQGTAPTRQAVEALPHGADLSEVLERLGAPSEAWRDRDGTVLVYRERTYAYERYGLDPSRALGALGLQQTATSALSNLRLVLEFGDLHEARLVALLDAHGRLEALGYIDADGQRWTR